MTTQKMHAEYAAHVGELILQALEERVTQGGVKSWQDVAQAWATVTGGMPPAPSEEVRRVTVI